MCCIITTSLVFVVVVFVCESAFQLNDMQKLHDWIRINNVVFHCVFVCVSGMNAFGGGVAQYGLCTGQCLTWHVREQ